MYFQGSPILGKQSPNFPVFEGYFSQLAVLQRVNEADIIYKEDKDNATINQKGCQNGNHSANEPRAEGGSHPQLWATDIPHRGRFSRSL